MNPTMDRIRRWDAPVTVAIAAGIAVSGSTVAVHLLLVSGTGSGLVARIGAGLWLFGGAFCFGALPAYASARYRVVSPALATAVLYMLTLLTSWSIMAASTGSAGGEITSTLFEIGLWYWPVALWLPLSIGAVEYAVRLVTGRRRGAYVENRTS